MIYVIVPSWNNAPWIERSLLSLDQQRGANFKVLVIDDCSTDGSWDLIQEFCEQRDHFSCYRNVTNQKCPKNLYEGIARLDPEPEDVIFILDGDDFLPHDVVLKKIKSLYSNPELWMTYGQYEPHPVSTGQTLARDFSARTKEDKSYRRNGEQLFNHPITFKAHLWNALKVEDFCRPDGQWYTVAYDALIMLPMLEMCTPDNLIHERLHWEFVNEVLYCYNAVNPLSDTVLNQDHFVGSEEIWKRPVKGPHVWES